MKLIHTILLVAILFLVGCFKEVNYKTTYIVKPLQQQSSTDVVLPIADARAYAFIADTSQWTVATYDDALNGVLTSKTNPTEKRNDAYSTSQPYALEGTEGWIQLALNREWQMVVVADPTNRLYAYTKQEVGFNLPHLYVSVVFKPWKEGKWFKDGGWLFFNEFYKPPIFLDCIIAPAAELAEGGDPTLIPDASLKAYAFAADTTEWYVASYADAVAGTITSKKGLPARTKADFTAYALPNTDHYSMAVSKSTLMVVVVDRASKIYAYTKQVVDLEGISPTFSVLFRPWQQVWIDHAGGWSYVNELYAPVAPVAPQTTSRP